jgi:hypothetical protein
MTKHDKEEKLDLYLLVNKGYEIRSATTPVTDHHRDGRCVCHILQNCPNRVGTPFYHQADDGRRRMRICHNKRNNMLGTLNTMTS